MKPPVVEEQALKISFGEASGGRGRGRSGTRGRGRGAGRRIFDKSTIECYRYNKLGHFQYECPNKDYGPRSNYMENNEEMLLMACVEEEKSNNKSDFWFLDSGCSNHMCGKREFFCDLDESFRETVMLGDDRSINVMGKGTVRLLVNGFIQVSTSVFYVPGLQNNLLSSGGQLMEKGLEILKRGGACKIYHPEKGLILEIPMAKNMMFKFFAVAQAKKETCFNSSMKDRARLWHRRYGHLSFNGLNLLKQKEMVRGLPHLGTSSSVCEDCLVGKQQRNPFPQESTWRASQVLELLHADICGPINPLSNSNKRYIITFIDDYSRKVWVYFLVTKSEAFVVFKQYKSRVEKESGVAIKGLRTDRGGEFTSVEFTNFCNDNELSKKFWQKLVTGLFHILNRSPTLCRVRNICPEEAWSGFKPSVAYFKVFGSIAYVHIPDCKRIKLDDKSKKCVFIGVSEESKAYRLYDLVSKRIIVSRDVVFDKEASWDWEKSHKESVLMNLAWGEKRGLLPGCNQLAGNITGLYRCYGENID
ncbi:retrovirus-related pol polyprotein from transposon TNT 1-94 [Tanacetum coccineum]